MDAYLADRILGQGLAVTPVLLSRACNAPLPSAREALFQFWLERKDELDASFVVVSTNMDSTEIKIVSVKDLGPVDEYPQIYSVAPADASDPAIILQLGEETRKLESQLPVATLDRLGVIVNPFARDVKGPSSQPTQPSKVPKTKVETQTPTDRKPKVKEASASTPTVKKENASTITPTTKKESSATKTPTVKKTSRESPFQSISKEQAMAKAFQSKPRSKVVTESVVGGEDIDANDPEDIPEKSQEEVDAQRQKLATLFDEPGPEEADLGDAEPEEEEESYQSDAPEEHEDLVLSDAPLPASDDEDGQTDVQMDDVDEKVDSVEPESAEAEKVSDEPESAPATEASPSESKPRTRKVKKIISEVVDGWTTTKEVFVEEPIEEAETTPAPAESTSKPVVPKTVTPDSKSEPKSDSKPKSGDKKAGQRPLTSFFAKRK